MLKQDENGDFYIEVRDSKGKITREKFLVEPVLIHVYAPDGRFERIGKPIGQPESAKEIIKAEDNER